MRILNFGSCNIDYVYSVSHLVKAGETISAGNMKIFPGGKGLNQSIGLAKAGAEVYHAGYLGNNGEILRKAMSESGVNLSFIENKDIPNGHAIIQVDANGENSIIIYGGTNTCISKEYIDRVLESFTKDDILLLQNEINDIHYIIDKAYKLGIKTVFNPAPFTDDLKDIDMKKIYCIILNETEAEGFCGTDSPDGFISYVRERYPHLTAILTLGSRGCIYIDKDDIIEQPAYKTTVADTTAAGDTFIGYFLASISDGGSSQEAIRLACAASAIAVSRHGAAPSIPYIDEVIDVFGKMQTTQKQTKTV